MYFFGILGSSPVITPIKVYSQFSIAILRALFNQLARKVMMKHLVRISDVNYLLLRGISYI